MMTPWPKDVRVNTLVSNHGVGTAGEHGIASVPDGSGGILLVWEDSGIALLRTQRLDASGAPLWTSGVVSTAGAYQASPTAATDGRGGSLVAWIDGRNGGCDSTSEMNCALYMQRIGPSGARLWSDDGLLITAQERYPAANPVSMIGDNANGAYIAWSSGQGYYNCCSFYMQHVGPDGETLWSANGIRVTELPAIKQGPGVTGARLVSDGNGGVIITWWNQQADNGSMNLMAQRVDPSGSLLWSDGGVQVTFAGAGHANFDAVSDGAGGVIVAVQSNDVAKSTNTHVYLQHVSPDGVIAWSPAGVQASGAVGAQITPSLAADGQGGAFVTWALWDTKSITNNRIAVQHVDSAGNLLWSTENTVTATSKGQANPRISADGNGGAIIAWEDCRSIKTNDGDCIAAYDVYAQRIDGSGQRTWPAEGLLISAAKANQGVDYGAEKRPGFEMLPDGTGAIFFVWPDGRLQKGCVAAPAGLCDLYAQRLAP